MKAVENILFTSNEMQKLLKVSGCHLMHMRTNGELEFKKSGNAFLYQLPPDYSLLKHPLGIQLVSWYKNRHPTEINNIPQSIETITSLEMLVADILIPVERKFGALQITYGFTSAELAKYIAKNSPSGTAPKLDQHASCEVNLKQNEICDRGGCACDFMVESNRMSEVVRFITAELNYDRIYYYGAERPLHVSVSEEPKKHLQIMCESEGGRRYPGKKGYAQDAIKLAEEL
jgi:hypothetical protein